MGTGEYHIGQGSTISLICVIENSPSPPQYVMWYHNDKMINYDGSTSNGEGGKVQVRTETGLGLRLCVDRWRQHSSYSTPRRIECDASLPRPPLSSFVGPSDGSLMDLW
ncbi:hypothetical protein GE061_015684 [Apolygus lucorum]|uniref:Ig-like domain-containing protein n=1 Tax=Apolygus lucorum TaxID=248454 RepID=A0A8S9XLN8_APOLU|nr:hypothetical protein GE061_015684 [Apolygus lucorum]